MKIGVPDPVEDKCYWMQIEKMDNRAARSADLFITSGETGYRIGQKFLLRPDIYEEFLYAHQQSNFPVMKRILDSVKEFDWSALPWTPKENQELLGL